MQEFGIVNEVLNLSNIYILLICFGLDESISKKSFSVDDKNETGVLSSGFILIFVHCGLFFLFALLFFLFPQANGVFTYSVYIYCVMFIINSSIINTYLKYCRIMGMDREFISVSLATTVIQFFAVYVLVVNLNKGLSYYLISMFIVSLFGVVYVLAKIKYKIKIRSITKSHVISIYMYAFKVAPHMIMGWGLLGFTIYSIGVNFDSYHTAIFVSHNYLSIILMTISMAFFYTYQPWLYRSLKNNVEKKLIQRKIFGFLIYASAFTVGAIVLSEFVFSIIFDDRYVFDFELSTLLLLGTFFQFSGSIFTYFFYYYESKSKFISYSTVVGVTVNVIGLTLLLPSQGLLAAGWVYMLSQLSAFVFRFIMYVKYSISGDFFINEQ
ncbi:lipopolysaccharide biosynthesis protein [Vibrio crassostreae]|uniref:lipopolysaccharide biosynthesis protein n=1 Tax=Vibrio crassostreae TaxID=246167 RepID=UPI001B30515B|nr:hypothetical protein [Vibrio crassostreae]